jgi:transcriptional regulator with XRE-family HTH domain
MIFTRYYIGSGGELTVQIESYGSNLGAIIKHSRKAHDLTQEQLAEKVGIGSRHLMAIENEGKAPSFEVLFKLIRILEISPDSIFYPDGKPEDKQFDRLTRLLAQCSERDVRIVSALVESMISNP